MKPIVKWQYEKLEGTLGLLEEHLADPDCPCHSDGENCARKHLKRAEDYAQETIILMARDPKSPAGELNKLDQLSAEAREYRQAEERFLCGKKVPEKEFATISWASNWRKYFETLLVSTCDVSARVKDLHPAVAGLEDVGTKIRISGTCKPGKTCNFKVKAIDTTEASTSSIADLDKVIQEVQKRASQEGAAVSNRTFAQGTTNVSRYEFDFRIVDAEKLVASHDPFTFVPNPAYPQDLQPRLRERAATRLQVERIAANIDPDALLIDYHSIDRGAPIIGPDRVVESGNGRVMALVYANKSFTGQYERYVQALKEIAPQYNLDPRTADRMKIPILVRERVTKVNRKQFVEEANASTTIETSSIEKARTDAEKISIEMLQSLEVLEGENIEDSLRASRNRAFVQSFLSKLSQNEQARLVDAKGVLNQDGVRRATMALFVATFSGDVGLRLAEKFFESTDINVRNVFNGLARSIGSLAVAEGLSSRGERDQLYTIGDDLAHAIGVFSAIKKTPGMTVEKYLHQSQLFERELTPFQERILVVLGENSKSSRKIGAILGEYARLVIESPPPAQVSLIPGMDRPTKAELFETAVKQGALADIVIAILEANSWISQKVDTCNLEPRQIDSIMSWKPLRDFIAWGTGVGNVKICEAGMGTDAYQVSIGGLDMQAKSTASGKVKGIPTAKRIYTPYNEVVYEITIPESPEDLTWQPQEIRKEPARPPEGRQAVLLGNTDLTCSIASPRYRYLEAFFESSPVLVMADPAGPPAEKERKIDQALAQLEVGIQNILESNNYQQYLRTLGKFHDYSLGNLILIWVQNPEASRVAGFNTWKDLGRFVQKGERGLMILAPCFPPKGKAEPKPEPEEEEEKPRIIERPVYFKVVHVFDITQTEGKDLPEVEVPVVEGEDSRPLFDLGLQYAGKNKIKILDKPTMQVSPATMGYYSPGSREIWVRSNVPQNQQTKTLFHEIAHSRATDKFGPGAEVLAESVAYAVCDHFGFDTGVRSFPYVALWARDVKVLKGKLDQIRAVTKEIIDEVVVLAQLRDSGHLEDFGNLGSMIITGIGLGIGFKTVDYLAGRIKQSASRDPATLEAMKLLTQENRKRLPPIRSQEHVEDPLVQVKFFTPWTYWTWYAIEFDGEDEFFGLVRGHEIELGYFSLKELESVRGPFGLNIERDRHFEPTPLSKVRAQLQEGKVVNLKDREVPKAIEVFKTTIAKHYRPKAAFHKGSFRVLKPNNNTLIYLGCLKTDDWRGKRCSENQTLQKTIVNKTKRGMEEVRKLEGEGIPVKYFTEEGVEPRAEDDILDEIAQALKTSQPV